MILKFFQLEKKNIENKRFLLFYGSNKGLIQDTIKSKIETLISNKAQKYEESRSTFWLFMTKLQILI